MKGFGHGTSRQINEVQALKAAQAEPRIIANEYRQYALIGQTVYRDVFLIAIPKAY